MTRHSQTKGKAFEDQVAAALEILRSKHPQRVRVLAQPHISLSDGAEVVPDFDLQFDLLFEKGRYLIECQNRGRIRPEVAHKIRQMKTLSSRNRFIFVYSTKISSAARRVLDADGVMVMEFEEFAAFLAKLEVQLRIQDLTDTDKDFDRFFRDGRRPVNYMVLCS